VKKFEFPVLAGVKVDTLAGASVAAAPTFTNPMLSMVDVSMTVVGVDVLKSVVRLMREPVTVTSSICGGAEAAAELLCSWALASPETPPTESSVKHDRTASRQSETRDAGAPRDSFDTMIRPLK
jgi:hypothetical protein